MGVYIGGVNYLPKDGDYIPMQIYGNGHIWINGSYKGVAIEITECKDCKHSKNCIYPAKWNWCPDGERKGE